MATILTAIFSGLGVFILGLIVAWVKWSSKKFVDERVEHSMNNGGGKIMEEKMNKANHKQTKQIIEVIKLATKNCHKIHTQEVK